MNKSCFNLGNDEKNFLATLDEENNYDYDEKTYIYDEKIVNDSHVAVVKQISEGSTVLDIGCASGIFGATIVKYKNCIVDGIEYDKEACNVAKSKNVYRNVYNFSITDIDSKSYIDFFNLNETYDYIVFADVLEHLVNPWDALVNVSKCLNKNGKIIISLPNVSHLDIIKGLIDNEFNYTKWGILDKTHLRFFTPSSFNDMVNNISDRYNVHFNIEKCEDILIKPPYFDDFERFKLFNVSTSLESYLALQNVYCLTLADTKEKMKTNIVNINSNNFEKMLDSFNSLYEQNIEKDKRINELLQKLEEKNNKRSLWNRLNRK